MGIEEKVISSSSISIENYVHPATSTEDENCIENEQLEFTQEETTEHFFDGSLNKSNSLVSTGSIENSLENEFYLNNGFNGNEDREKYKQLAYEYYLKTEDLENRCIILHRNLTEMKEAWDRARSLRDQALKEKENMTVKYATGERNLIAERKFKVKVEKKCKQLTEEKSILHHKLKVMEEEKVRISLMYDEKVHKQKNIQSEIDSIKNDNCILENELKLCQCALKKQAELYNSTQKQVEHLNERIFHSTEQIEKAKRDAQESIKSYELCKQNQTNILFEKEKELQTSLILIKHDRDATQEQVRDLRSANECLKSKNEEILKQNNELSHKVAELLCKNNMNEFVVDQQLQVVMDLNSKSARLEEYELRLTSEEDELRICNEKVIFLESRNADLENDLKSMQRRDSDLLLFTEHLTDRTVHLQSEFAYLVTQLQQIERDQNVFREDVTKCEDKYAILLKQLDEEKMNMLEKMKKNDEDVDLLKKQLMLQQLKNTQLKQQLLDQKGETDIIRRKYSFSMKEIRRELHRYMNTESERYTVKSCASSCNSLSSIFSTTTCKTFSSDNQVKVIQPENDVNTQMLIERIAKLQRISARKSEKIDFLEDQINILRFELQKKSKLLQMYMLKQQAGVFRSHRMDPNRDVLAKLRGVMTYFYSARNADDQLTSELSPDIYRKLQELLEDVLLHNITLKNNIDTLGNEIDRLNKELKILEVISLKKLSSVFN